MRAINQDEITQLESCGCVCDNWGTVMVDEAFNPKAYRNVTFLGHIELGGTDGSPVEINGIPYAPGIANATVKDCRIGDNAHIYNISGGVNNYEIGAEAAIIGCHTLTCTSNPTFGIGAMAATLDETGSRPVALGPWLTSQLAYAALTDTGFNTIYNSMSARLAPAATPPRGIVGARTVLNGCRHIENVNVGTGARLDGANRIVNATIVSTPQSPATIGAGVIAQECVFMPGSQTTGHACLTRCFIGEAACIESLTAHDSLFFANSHLCNGEAAAIFAGPFTVSEHKSTLLIGGTFMMFNAGSGTNQSNHLYKLGPEYFGFTDRGVRAGSDSYILWPAHIGAFTTILGRHYTHPDTTAFPFSYLVAGADGTSRLIPGIALERISVERDTRKWPARDRRLHGADIIAFEALNPHTIGQMQAGLQILKQHDPYRGALVADGFHIEAKDVDKGIARYEDALLRYYGRFIESHTGTDDQQPCIMHDQWVDMGGLVTNHNRVQMLAEHMTRINTPEELADALADMERQTASDIEAHTRQQAMHFAKAMHLTPDGLVAASRQAQRRHLNSLIAEGTAEGLNTGKDFIGTTLAKELTAQLEAFG